MGRKQFVLIPTTLDDVVPEGHDARILEELLRGQDWSEREAEDCLVRGQPPIPPRVVASVILYGLLRRIRSSRVLESMTGHNVDSMWLTEGRTIDHTTICKFRRRFKKQLAEADAARCREGLKTPAQLPSTDSDSTVLPNKEGGYAPNYTPTAAVDTHRDFIVDAKVLPDANENAELVPMVDRVEEALGQRPEADASHRTRWVISRADGKKRLFNVQANGCWFFWGGW